MHLIQNTSRGLLAGRHHLCILTLPHTGQQALYFSIGSRCYLYFVPMLCSSWQVPSQVSIFHRHVFHLSRASSSCFPSAMIQSTRISKTELLCVLCPSFVLFFSKGIGFIKERASTKLSEQTLRGVKSLPQGRDHSSFISLPVLICTFLADSVRPHRRQPIRLPRPWDSPGKNTGVGCHFLLQ